MPCCGVAQLITRVSRFPGPLLGITAWSYASLKHAHVDLFTALARRACELAKLLQLKPLDANQLVRAAAKMCFRDEPMFQACALVSWIRVQGNYLLSNLIKAANTSW